ncbi:hypothetical protein TREMEDRAFT_67696 [Tremella mesenterica DSM 1558]|uniref:uncharacterized protein n=1 Tax=Tremella mesenterica (strain ATCC 24925 / CBS 8224 / DSM 1558 / NBRC 9311 / NRRL Y-6157 / RJB 2259-6 / UBC 559-6) TaxID=578456 RepID=UPI0003F491AD|nr:uncharacterized protein TREMEDRAFT_67696 [Tremella mesenterica DSM 1558]EIW71319.1 hypothetical protein TREMEDRAFT_67696 [Tremella mesenterica DSM 1558]
MSEPKPIPPPRYPGLILTSCLEDNPAPHTLKLLEKLCKNYIGSDEVFSVTYSPLLCPEGKNYLYTLKPYWWEVEPGHWDCELPQGQNQLQKASMAIHTLALGSKYLPYLADQCSKQAENLLRYFFINHDTRMLPEILYAQCNPSSSPLRGDQAFVIAVKLLDDLKTWFRNHLDWMATSEQGAMARAYGNNITIWYHALVATHLSLVNPPEAAVYSLTALQEIHARHTTPESFFSREVSRTRPRHYTLFTLEPVFLLSSQTGKIPPDNVYGYLRDLVEYARHVMGSPIEIEVDDDPRYFAKLEWFETMLKRWSGQSKKTEEPDGTQWDGGWNQFARLLWGFI